MLERQFDGSKNKVILIGGKHFEQKHQAEAPRKRPLSLRKVQPIMHRGLCCREAVQNSNMVNRSLVMYKDILQILWCLKQN